MPIFEYGCAACGHHWELIISRDAPLPDCPLCGKPGKKAVSAPAFQFKGTGWYVTDYAKSGADGKKQAKSESAAHKASDGKSTEGAPAAAPKGETPAAKAEAPAPAKPAPSTGSGNGT